MIDLKNYEGLYAITEDGQVWGYKRKNFLTPHPDKDGYLYITLSKNSQYKTCRVHRLVAETFIPNPDNLPEVHHIDSDPANNNVNNLQWVTQEENLIDMYVRQLKKLDVSIDEIKRRYEYAG